MYQRAVVEEAQNMISWTRKLDQLAVFVCWKLRKAAPENLVMELVIGLRILYVDVDLLLLLDGRRHFE